MDIFSQLADRIIKEQESIIGPVALEQAKKVPGLKIESNAIKLEGDKKNILADLVMVFHDLFGPASDEVSRSAVKTLISQAPKDQIPQVLL